MADPKENALFAYLESLVETNTQRDLLNELKQTYDRPSDEEIAVMVERESFLRRQKQAEDDRKAAEALAIQNRKEAAERLALAAEAAVQAAKAAAEAAAADEKASKPSATAKTDASAPSAKAMYRKKGTKQAFHASQNPDGSVVLTAADGSVTDITEQDWIDNYESAEVTAADEKSTAKKSA